MASYSGWLCPALPVFTSSNSLTLTIASPTSNELFSNATINVTGKAGGTVPVEEVFYKLNNGPYLEATTSNSWTNWTVSAILAPGTNLIQAYAVDMTGTVLSPTKSVSVFYVVTTALTVNTNGNGTVSPNDNGALLGDRQELQHHSQGGSEIQI